MEDQAASLLATLKKPSAPVDQKLTQFNSLKSSIKHLRVPQECTPTIFECVRLAIAAQTSSTLVSTGFSTLGHLIKRLHLQSQTQVVTQESNQLLPILLDRLGDARESQRNAASQALSDLWPYNHPGVEGIVREGALGGTNSRAKEVAMQWVVKMHASDNLPFKSFVPYLVASLEDSDGMVRETAKSAVVELFKNAPDHAKNDLKKKMNAHNVRKTIANYVIANLGLPGAVEVDSKASTIELEDLFRDMHPHFEGRETEHNWLPREKSVLKIRRMLKGNAPTEHESVFIAGVLSLRDGILKVANSLRTTHATNGCQCIQELARTLGPAIDPMVEILLQNFIKMSANTKNIAAQNGNVTVDTIFAHASYTNRMMQHVGFAIADKNVQPRTFSAGWLKTLFQRNAAHKSHFEHTGGLDSTINVIKKGLADANPKVRENFRATYWAFAKIWPGKAEAIMENMDAKQASLLQKDPNNPNASVSSSSGKGPSSKLKSQASRSSLKDTIAAQRKAALAARKMPDRPSSAQSSFSPNKTPKSKSPERLSTNDAISTEEVKVYEDPFAGEAQRPSDDEKPVLEELPVNEQNRDRRMSSETLDGERPGSSEGQKSNGANGAANGGEEVVQDRAEVLRTRRLLSSGIERIRAKTLDAHGFRRLQDVVKGDLDIWGEQDQRFGELLMALLEYLETPVDATKTPNIKAQNLKTQVLGTIRAMLVLHRKKSGPYYARALCSVLASRAQWDTASHITTDIEKTADEIVKYGQTADLISGILDFLDSSNAPNSPASAVSSDQSRPASASPSPRTVTLSLQTLSTLLQISAAKNVNVTDAQAQQLGRLAVKFLGSLDPDVRRADMDFCVQLHERLGGEQDGGFWKAVAGADKGHLNLITYYLARRNKA
ncbi:putative heat repeat containing protein [Neofusicoccum parvum UCRNP2]|uniref:Putative heat repeat containing protein n=1 Tax=Botryosphaeria parva (strain UCR-NP2) TaxID=1287680 RepID=R1G658_BOTPV|nr:putative heat repeat containing protein [Neofusicoccum parvum UCRNP2]